jgi:hypothetical protein
MIPRGDAGTQGREWYPLRRLCLVKKVYLVGKLYLGKVMTSREMVHWEEHGT